LRTRRATIHRPLHHLAFDLLLDAGHPYLEELVKIRTGDAEELQLFQEGGVWIDRFVQHTLVEFQPTQLPIDEVLRLEL
jgi:hypothetical protein